MQTIKYIIGGIFAILPPVLDYNNNLLKKAIYFFLSRTAQGAESSLNTAQDSFLGSAFSLEANILFLLIVAGLISLIFSIIIKKAKKQYLEDINMYENQILFLQNKTGALEKLIETQNLILLDNEMNILEFSPQSEKFLNNYFSGKLEKNSPLSKCLPKNHFYIFEELFKEAVKNAGTSKILNIDTTPGTAHIKVTLTQGNTQSEIYTLHLEDITAKHKDYLNNNKRVEYFKSIFEESGEAALIIENERIVDCNNQALELFSLKEHELISKPFLELSGDKHSHEVFEKLINDLKEEGFKTIQWDFKTNQQALETEVNFKLIDNSNSDKIIATIRDISNWKEVEKSLLYQKQELTTVSESILDVIFIISLNSEIEYITDSCYKIFGYTSAELKNRKFLDLIPTNYQSSHWNLLNELYHKKEIKSHQTRIVTKQGKIIPVEINFKLINKNGEYFAQGVLRDIVRRIESEEVLKSQKAFLDELINGINEGVGIVDSDEEVVFCNEAFANFFEEQKSSLIGRNILDFFDEESKKIILAQTELRKKGILSTYDLPFITSSGRKKYAKISVSPRYDKENSYLGSFGSLQDVTQQKKAEIELEEYRQNLEYLVKERTKELSKSNDKLYQEIFERKQTEVELEENRKLYKDLVEKAGIAILIDNADGNFVYFNDRFCDMFEYNAEELSGKKLHDLVHPDDFSKVLDIHFSDRESRDIIKRYDFLGIKKDGSKIHVEVSSEILFNGKNFEGHRTYLWDITDRINSEKELYKIKETLAENLRHQEALLYCSRTLLSVEEGSLKGALSYLINAINVRRIYIFKNEIKHGKGLCTKLMVDVKSTDELINTDNLNDCMEYDDGLERWEKYLSAGDPIFGYIHDFPEREREVLEEWDVLSILLIPIFVDNKWFGFIGFDDNSKIRDWEREAALLQTASEMIGFYLQRSSSENQLQLAKENAEKANKMKSEFLANVSHEIRTPLNGIIGFTEIILNSETIHEVHNQAKTILSESESLLALINDLLDHAKIEAGKTELELRPMNLRNLAEELISVLNVRAEERSLKMHLKIADSVPNYIIADKLRLRQILMNLLSNSLKFTEEGYIAILIDCIDFNDEYAEIAFAVEDTGIGIPKEKQTNIFKSFIQADGSTTRKYGGTGLGTSISKQLVELMGGEIGLDSIPGEGTVVWFKAKFEIGLPTDEDEDIIVTPEIKEVLEEERKNLSTKILLVEDYQPNQEVAKMHLQSVGHEVVIAENGQEAVSKCQEETFDLILMDVQMPVMDGYDATDTIRNDANTNSNVPILALTANINTSTRQECLSAGMNDIINKPIRKKSFLDIVDKWLFLSEKPSQQALVSDIDEKPVEENPVKDVEFKPIDLEVAVEEFGDLETVRQVVSQFMLNVKKQIPLMMELYKEKDFETLRREAHSIKGGAATLEALPLSEAAKSIEFACKNEEYNGIPQLFDYFVNEFEVLKEYIKVNL